MDEYEAMFEAPLSTSKQEAFRVMFKDDVPLDFSASEFDGLLPEDQ